MVKSIRARVLLVAALMVTSAMTVRAQHHRPTPPMRPTQSKDKLHELAVKSGGHFVLRYRPNRSAVYPNVEELAKRSDVIIVGRALRHRSSLLPNGNFITQDCFVRVHEVIKGDLAGARSVTVTLPGGVHRFSDGTLALVEPLGNRQAEDQGLYVFFLKTPKKNSPFKGYVLVSELQGMFAVTDGKVEPSDESPSDSLAQNYQGKPAADFLKEIHKAVPKKGNKGGGGN
jgi:hypothetical protein